MRLSLYLSLNGYTIAQIGITTTALVIQIPDDRKKKFHLSTGQAQQKEYHYPITRRNGLPKKSVQGRINSGLMYETSTWHKIRD